MKKFFFLFVFILFSCSSDDDVGYPSLTITNENEIIIIHTVSLDSYKIENLSIGLHQSKTFTLLNGFNGGLDNVNVIVQWSCGGKNNWSKNKSLNFKVGDNTSITLISTFQNGGGCIDVDFK